jgi:glycosyltransferase involved in cell wall biosynthesis
MNHPSSAQRSSHSSEDNETSRQPLRVLIVTQFFFPFIGGVETHIRQVAHEFVVNGHQVEIAAMNFSSPKTRLPLHVLHPDLLAPTTASYIDDSVPVHSLAPANALERARLLPMGLRAVPVLRRYAYHGLNRLGFTSYRSVLVPKLAELVQRADVIHSMSFSHLGWAAQWAAREAGKPFVCTPFVHPGQWGDGADDIEYYRRSDAVIALVDTDRDYLVRVGVPQEKIQVTGVSPDLPPQVNGTGFRTRHKLPPNAPIILFVGRMTAHKGAEAVIAAAPIVWNAVPEAHFFFIGPQSSESATWFSEVTDPRIRYLGKVDSQEKGDAIDACTIFCMPSRSEILPTVYLEAWSRGKPVIGGMAPGLPQLVEGSGGGRCTTQEPGKVASALIDLLKNASVQRKHGEAGRTLVEEKYSVPAVTEQLESLYRQVIRKHTSNT